MLSGCWRALSRLTHPTNKKGTSIATSASVSQHDKLSPGLSLRIRPELLSTRTMQSHTDMRAPDGLSCISVAFQSDRWTFCLTDTLRAALCRQFPLFIAGHLRHHLCPPGCCPAVQSSRLQFFSFAVFNQTSPSILNADISHSCNIENVYLHTRLKPVAVLQLTTTSCTFRDTPHKNTQQVRRRYGLPAPLWTGSGCKI
ncbi:hypothetical protein HMPREF0986_01540 [Escherichia coli 4_1_47FAA]|nr:hypothetical protein HMPREF0986_01540 [Escherichia coli 4_1_47FAA]